MTVASPLRTIPASADRQPRATSTESSREATYPHGYPNGWYVIAESDEVRRGQVIEVTALGERFAVYRSDVDGTVGVLEAHCPHLGANLARGSVQDGCVKCPFHEWTFDASGKVRSIPYASRVPGSLRARAFPVRELDGLIFVWSAQHGARPHSAPDYAIPQMREASGLVYRGRYDAGTVRMHLCEFAENSADFQHFRPLHGPFLMPWTGWRIPGLSVSHEATWRADPDQPHLAWFEDRPTVSFRGKPVRSGGHATIQFVGPASVVRFSFATPEPDGIVLYHTHTPVEPLRQRVRFRWYARPHVSRLLVSAVVTSWIAQWRSDIDIWEQKIYRPKPMLVAEDGPIHELRRWFAQFYA